MRTIENITKENDYLRKKLAESGADCPYCGLEALNWAKCASGFPGCGRADDAFFDSREEAILRQYCVEQLVARHGIDQEHAMTLIDNHMERQLGK